MATDTKLMVALPAVALLMTGCGISMTDNHDGSSVVSSSVEAWKRLESWPSLEDSEQQLRSTIEEIGRAVTAIVPSAKWEWVDEGDTAGCTEPFAHTDGSVAYTPSYIAANVDIPEDRWPELMKSVHDIATRVGAAGSQVMANRSRNHTVWFYNDADQTRITLGYRGNLVIGGRTGCRLPKGSTRHAR